MADTRKSDRWLTPGVIIAGLLVAGLLAAAVIGSVAYLTARGIDPDPMLKLTGVIISAAGSLGSFVLLLGQRAQTSKTERNTGVLAGNHAVLVDAVAELRDAVTDADSRLASTTSAATAYQAAGRPPVPVAPMPARHGADH